MVSEVEDVLVDVELAVAVVVLEDLAVILQIMETLTAVTIMGFLEDTTDNLKKVI